MEKKIKIIVADDHHLLVNGIKAAINGSEQIEVIASFHTAGSLVEQLPHYPADILLLDVQFPDKTANEIIEVLLNIQPDLKIIIFSSISSNYYIKELLKLGCKGYLLKDNTTVDQLISVISSVMSGKVYLDQDIKEEIFMELIHHKTPEKPPIPQLSKREIEILKLIVEEKTNLEMAEMLFVSVRTIENHRNSLFQKLNVKNSVGLVKAALTHDLI